MVRCLPQLICFSYHKTGTSLLLHVMTKVSQRLGLVLANQYGLVERLDPAPDIVLLPHALLRARPERPYRAIRLIRDPRDIWVSGYLYHLRCDEGWCRNTDLDPTPPIQWPKVDYSFAHWPEDWKHHYLERLNGRSYQQNLRDLSLGDGVDFELEGYTGCTLTSMREWRQNGVAALDLRLEDVMADFDGGMLRIFGHFGFTTEQSHAALEVARSEDIRRMDDAAIAERPQINSRTISKWRDVLSPAQIARFEASHGDLIRELGYEIGGAIWRSSDRRDTSGPAEARASGPAAEFAVNPVPPPPVGRVEEHQLPRTAANTTPDAGLRLAVDGRRICPTAIAPGSYSFVVPAGSASLRLESRFGTTAEPRAPGLIDTRRLGVRVSRITVRSGADEVVIAADDPSLTVGWYDAERKGTELWRWTDGSAGLPRACIASPAIVTVFCTTLAEYRLENEDFSH